MGQTKLGYHYKKLIFGVSIILVIFLIIIILLIDNNTKRIVISNEESKQLMNTNALTMMYETEAGSGEYQVTSDTTWPQDGYVFNEILSKCENGSKMYWDSQTNRVMMESNTSDKCYVYFDVALLTLADYITTEVYTGTDGDNDLYYHDGVGSYTNANLEAGDNSYRYSGANPNNYVCFGSDAASCPVDNLYRIIGVFGNQVKLIKHDYATTSLLGTNVAYYNTYSGIFGGDSSYYKGSLDQSTVPIYYWNGTYVNTWSTSELNTVNLNQNYLNNIGNKWSSLIATTTWQVGGAAYANIYSSPVKTAYNYEVGPNKANTTYSAKIGLMYASDYGYAASPANWSTNMGSLNNDTNRNNNWMFMGLHEWTISHSSDTTDLAFPMYLTGSVYGSDVGMSYYGVRPSFYLESSVAYAGGTGTASDPILITD